MRYRVLGGTGLVVSEVGFGGIPIMKGPSSILPQYYNLTSNEAIAVMEHAFELGCNLYDTAVVPEYGDSELKVGRFARRRRGEIFVSDKARAYSGAEMRQALQKSLRNLRLDVCDIYFVHQVAPETVGMTFGSGGALDVLHEYRAKGHVRAVGIATHHFSVARIAANDERVDVIQLPGNVLERGILDRVEQDASFSRVGLILHKVYAAGVLTDWFSPRELIEFVLSYPIHCALIGMGSVGQVCAATNYRDAARMDKGIIQKRMKAVFDPIPCTRCQRCACPSGVDIQSLYRYYNYYCLGHRTWALNKLRDNSRWIRRTCSKCLVKSCTDRCPEGLNIRDLNMWITSDLFLGGKRMVGGDMKAGRDYIGIGVGAVIMRDDAILLLLRRRAPEAGCWTIPGGRVEFGETVEQAILREVQEELNARARIVAPLGVTDHILPAERTHWVSPRFLVELLDEPVNSEPDAHEDMNWFSVNELPDNVTQTTRKALAAFFTWHRSRPES